MRISEELKKENKIADEKHRKYILQRLEARKESIENLNSRKIDIPSEALIIFNELGFDITKKGTTYLADLVEEFYLERKVYDNQDEYFNLNNRTNNHYYYLTENHECGFKKIHERINEELSRISIDGGIYSINELVYSITDNLIDQYDQSENKTYFIRK